MNNLELDFLQEELSRVSEWVQFADKKAGFVGVFYSAILGLLITKRGEIFYHLFFHHRLDCTYALLLAALMAVIIIGVYHLFSTVSPRLKNSNTNRSLFYFGTVANMKIEDYLEDIEQLTEEDARRQIAEQIYTNSVIANTKMDSVRKSTQALIVASVLVLFLFVL